MGSIDEENSGPLSHDLEQWLGQLQGIREIVLANAVMMGEIPAPTFKEENRIRFLTDRFTESGLQHISIDEVGNGVAVIPGRTGEKKIIVSAHADTVFGETVDHAIAVDQTTMSGPGIADNSLGLATLASLPHILEHLGVQLDADLILLGASRSLGAGDISGIRTFLDNLEMPIHYGICIAGVHLGRLSYSSLGLYRGTITCVVPDEYDWVRFGTMGAISNLSKIIQRIQAIPLPREPRSSIILGSIKGGQGFSSIAHKATLNFEVRSEDGSIVEDVHQQIASIVQEVSATTETEATLESIAERAQGGIAFSHPLVKKTQEILQTLKVPIKIAPSVGEICALIDKGIPSLTLGLTQGHLIHDEEESIEIEPIFTGITQLIALLTAIDKGECDE